jgi:CTP:molybdopterin cytidylyltransferase MocA
MSRIATIVLAAGTSERFGALDKLAAPVAGRSLLSWTLDAATHDAVAEADRFVVVGPGSAVASRIAEAHGWRTTFAHDAPRGMGASLRAGLSAAGADPDVAGAVVVLGDDPLAARLLDQVVLEALTDPGVAAAVHRTPFLPHPVYLPRDLWPTPGEPIDDHGLRGHLDPDSTRWIDDAGVRPIDVDVPDDVERLHRMLTTGP